MYSDESKERMEKYKKLGKKGDVEAIYFVGELYQLRENTKLMMKYFRLAAEQGHAEAQYELGCSYCGLKGVKRNKKEAIRLWTLAAEQNHPIAKYCLETFNWNSKMENL